MVEADEELDEIEVEVEDSIEQASGSSDFILSLSELGRTRTIAVPRVKLTSSFYDNSTASSASKQASSAPLLRAWALASHLTQHVLSPWQLDDFPVQFPVSDLSCLHRPSSMVITSQRGLATIPDLLASMRPYRVPFGALSVAFLHHEIRNELHHLMTALNGSMVALCAAHSLSSASVISNGASSPPSIQLVSADSQTPPRCLGLGLIRAIDVVAGCFYILTSVVPAELSSVNLLIKSPTSTLDLPATLTQLLHFTSGSSSSSFSSSQPYFSIGSLPSAVADTASTRKNVARKRL
jgi:hypothetical protein